MIKIYYSQRKICISFFRKLISLSSFRNGECFIAGEQTLRRVISASWYGMTGARLLTLLRTEWCNIWPIRTILICSWGNWNFGDYRAPTGSCFSSLFFTTMFRLPFRIHLLQKTGGSRNFTRFIDVGEFMKDKFVWIIAVI